MPAATCTLCVRSVSSFMSVTATCGAGTRATESYIIAASLYRLSSDSAKLDGIFTVPLEPTDILPPFA